MKFKKEILQDLADLAKGDSVDTVFEVVKNDLEETTRWSNVYYLVFKFGGKFYSSSYSVGATESQDESPYEYDDDMIECSEVFPMEKVITVYVEDKKAFVSEEELKLAEYIRGMNEEIAIKMREEERKNKETK